MKNRLYLAKNQEEFRTTNTNNAKFCQYIFIFLSYKNLPKRVDGREPQA